MALRIEPTPAALTGSSAPATPVNAQDFTQFAALRRGADAQDPATLRQVARQFESIFTKMMLDSMRSASFGDSLFGSDQADMYQGLMDDQLAVQLSSGEGIGLADMLIRQLSQGGAPLANAGAARPASAELPISAEQRAEFIQQLLPHARAAARELGVDERAVIAQAALETGWGTHRPADASGDSHNYFGIKAGQSWRGAQVQSETQEFLGGEQIRETAPFRAYGSVAESVSDYVRLLRDNPRYAAALNTGADVQAFASALQRGGYATDPRYAEKLVSVAARLGPLDVKSFKSAEAGPIHPARTEGNG